MNKKITLFYLICSLTISSLIQAQVPATWTVNLAAYQYQMSVTALANQACIELSDPNNYVAAFVGNQCRGVSGTNTQVGSKQLGLLTVKSNVVNGEVVKFKIYNATSNAVINVLDSIVFNQGNAIGTLMNPFTLYSNHAPTNLALSTYTVAENSALSAVVATLSATDQDAGTVFNYSLTAGQPENTQFTISGNQLLVNSNFNFEVDSKKIIEIKVDDNGGCSFTKTFTVTVIDVNDAPTALTLTTTMVYDNQQANSYIGRFFTADEDVNDVQVYSLVAGLGDIDNAQFYIQNDTLYNTYMINFNAQPTYLIRARSTDLGGLFIENTFTINVSNVNDAPTNITLSHDTVAENRPIGTLVATLTVADEDLADTHTLTLIPGTGSQDNSKFSIVGNVLQTNAVYNFEQQDSLYIRIQAADPLNATFVKTFTIVVIDKNEAPTNILLSDTSIIEGLPAGSYVGSITTIDEDIASTYTYSLVTGLGDTDNTLFAINTNSLVSNATYSFTNQTYSIRVRTTDAGSLFFEKTILIVVRDSNYVPTDIIPSVLAFDENITIGTPVSTLTTIDNDATDTHTLTLVSGAGSTDNSYFTIVGNVLQTDSAINYEQKNIFYIRVKSTDIGNASVVKTFTLNANDVNEAPTNINLSGDSIVELAPINTLIGNLTSIDEDASATHTYSLATGLGDADNALFTISGNQLQSNSVFNYLGQTYSVRIQSIDNGGLTFEKAFTIRVLNINDAPTDIIIDTLSLKEDNEPIFYISKIRSADIDNPDYHTYTLVSGAGDTDNAEFTIVNDKLIIKDKTNYDVKDLYTIRVKSTDVGGLSVEKAFEVAVIDVVGNSIPLPSTNFISPNGDGKNDFWKVINVEIYKDFELKIFDQFGQVIYNVPNNYNNEFDGKLNGTALPTGNYYYIFKNNKKQYQGNITIVN